MIEEYKELCSFQLELQRLGQVTYEYGYCIALAWFWALFFDMEVTEDPFAILPKDKST